MTIGFKSDIHLDFWIKNSNNPSKIKNFIKKILSPISMDVLIIAGDLGHYNYQNYLLLKELKNYAKNILIVFGNHDLYLVSNSQKEKYKTSFNRLDEFKKMVSEIEGVYFLDGDVVEIDGVRFAGAGCWYDFSYAIKKGYSLGYVYNMWLTVMNDAKKIIPLINPVDFSFAQKERLRSVIDLADVVISHVPPVYIECYDDVFFNSFYTFYGYDLISQTNAKYWIFGHCHEPHAFVYEKIKFLSSPLGYPNVRRGKMGIDLIKEI